MRPLSSMRNLYEYAQREMMTANFEQTRAAKRRSSLVEQTENYRVPEILDYVRKKALLFNLQRDCEVWQRKLELVSVNIDHFHLFEFFLGFFHSRWVYNSLGSNGKRCNELLDIPVI